jgi:hypothetical protein
MPFLTESADYVIIPFIKSPLGFRGAFAGLVRERTHRNPCVHGGTKTREISIDIFRVFLVLLQHMKGLRFYYERS